MNIIRVRSTEVIKHIEPHLTFTDPEYRAGFVDAFIVAMTNNPDAMMVLAGIEDDKVEAFLIAENPGFRTPYVQILQAWNSNDNGELGLGKEFLELLMLWAKMLGKTHIRAETTRNTAAIYRKYQFRPISSNVRFDLDDSGLESLLHQEPNDG